MSNQSKIILLLIISIVGGLGTLFGFFMLFNADKSEGWDFIVVNGLLLAIATTMAFAIWKKTKRR